MVLKFHKMLSLITNEVKSRVSSVLNKDGKQFGKKFMFDDSDETCWNSDQGTPQWVQLDFPHPISISEIHIQFQGGFAGKHCSLEIKNNSGVFDKLQDFYPEDSNSMQILENDQNLMVETVRKIKKLYVGNARFATDLYGGDATPKVTLPIYLPLTTAKCSVKGVEF